MFNELNPINENAYTNNEPYTTGRCLQIAYQTLLYNTFNIVTITTRVYKLVLSYIIIYRQVLDVYWKKMICWSETLRSKQSGYYDEPTSSRSENQSAPVNKLNLHPKSVNILRVFQ